MRLLFRLLRKNVNFWQIAGFALANLVGAVIVLFGIQAYQDAEQVLKSPDSVLSNRYIVISKPVSSVTTLAGALGAGPRSFSEEQIEEISELDGVAAVATFRTARFLVEGGISYGGFNISTEMFVESVPEGFLDVDPAIWTASPDAQVVPVVIPRTYLNFYNYGFAAARGTPQLGEELFSQVPLNLVFYGREGRKVYTGKIVGLTDRLNSILVPDDFLCEANRRFSTMSENEPTRVIVEVSGSEASKELMDHIQKKKYVIDGGNEDAVRMLAIVRTIISIVVALGLLVSALAFFLLLISILLLIEKNRYKNDVLHQLGYPDRKIALPYQALAVGVDFVVWFVGALITLLLYPLISSLMQTISPAFQPSGPILIILSSFGLFLFFAVIHVWLIRRKIR